MQVKDCDKKKIDQIEERHKELCNKSYSFYMAILFFV